MQRWADIEDDTKLDAAVTSLPQEVRKQVGDLRTTIQILKIQRVSFSALLMQKAHTAAIEQSVTYFIAKYHKMLACVHFGLLQAGSLLYDITWNHFCMPVQYVAVAVAFAFLQVRICYTCSRHAVTPL